MRAEVRVNGIVQGVGFRPFVYRAALRNKLKGYVQNQGDATVEIVVEGKETDIQNFLQEVKTEKPPLAQIHDLIATYGRNQNQYESFTIIKSTENVEEVSGSVVSPDVSICDECLKELRTLGDPRHDYFFITCTNCGPRYTIIERLPYDRSNTTMKKFATCDFCQREYSDPANRRFHAQTVACPKCGPKAYLTDNNGEPVDSQTPIREAGRLLDEGYIVAIKGYGGFHVATATTKPEPISRLRNIKHRRQKPFAIMTRDLKTVQSFANVNQKEAELLTSPIRPVVLLNKNKNYFLSDLVAPNLHNVGVMLPYTGLHFLLFDEAREPAFVMTSANSPNQPIVADNDEAVEKLGSIVDYFLFHGRIIAQRCDDSVVRVHGATPSLIRRSRGYVPAPILLQRSFKTNALGLGAELNSTSCVLTKNKAFLSQHVGDVENFETFQFLKNASSHLMHLTSIKPEVVACDLHPRFTSTKLAHALGEAYGCPVVAVQHHHAHAASLVAERGIDEMVAAVCDGYGYGSDGTAWGGEIMLCDVNGGFKRLGHLQPQPMIGGDLASSYPIRMAAGILRDVEGLEEWLKDNCAHLPHGKQEAGIILQQMNKGSLLPTTSCGRVLDAVAAILGICYERTYEGEPAMKLESAALAGTDALSLEPQIQNHVIDTTRLVEEVFKHRREQSVADLAFSAQTYLARSLAELAIREAERVGVEVVGFSGGVACNEQFTSIMRRLVEENGLRFVVHELVPAGDGGVCLGQAVIAAWTANTL